jgi:hypothetical protein
LAPPGRRDDPARRPGGAHYPAEAAMGFLNPWMLIGLGAAGIPVLVHLVYRRKAKLLPFPSIVFLRELDREVVRRRRLEQILVMLLRIAVLVLFTLFIAKPFLSSRLFASGASKAVVIVLDDSYSMQVVEGKPLYEKARERALELISTLDRNDKAGLLSACGTPGRSLNEGTLSTDHAALVRHIEALGPGYGTARFNDAIARALDVLRESKEQNRAIVVVTDLQRRSWAELSIPDADEDVTFLVVNVAGASTPVNAAMTDLEILTTPERELSRTFTLRATLRNFSGRDFEGTFALSPLSGQSIDESALTIRPTRTVERSLKLRAEHEGWYTGKVVIGDDDLAIDNARFYALRVGRGIRVGIFDPKVGIFDPAPPRAEAVREFDDVFFLEKGLDPLGTRYPFDVTTFAELTRDALEKLDVAVFPTLPELTPLAHIELKNWLRLGGRVVCFVRQDANARRVADLLDREITVGDVEPGLYKIGSDQLGLERLLFDVDVFKRAPLAIAEGSPIVALATFQDEVPYIVERDVGAGKVVLFASGYDLDSTNVALRHASVPLMYTLLFRIAPAQTHRSYTVGDVVPVEADWRAVVNPRGEQVELGEAVTLTMPGIYSVRAGTGDAMRLDYFAVNVDPAEGNLARFSVRRQLESLVPFRKWDLVGTDKDLARTLRALDQGAPLWNWFLYAALVVFLVEAFMANKAGQRV